MDPENCVMKRVDFPSEFNTQETPFFFFYLVKTNTCRQRAIFVNDASDKSLPTE